MAFIIMDKRGIIDPMVVESEEKAKAIAANTLGDGWCRLQWSDQAIWKKAEDLNEAEDIAQIIYFRTHGGDSGYIPPAIYAEDPYEILDVAQITWRTLREAMAGNDPDPETGGYRIRGTKFVIAPNGEDENGGWTALDLETDQSAEFDTATGMVATICRTVMC